MRNEEISRRSFLVFAGGGLVLSTVPLTGCPAVARYGAPVVIRFGIPIARVAWGAFQRYLATMAIKAIIDQGEKILRPNMSASDIAGLQSNNPLIVEDVNGKQFNTPYVMCEYAGTVQPCYRGESRTMHVNPNFDTRTIKTLDVGEALGVIDLTHVNGWYHVQDMGGEKGWVHGNCLQKLPRGD